jgi:hypothetical protein
MGSGSASSTRISHPTGPGLGIEVNNDALLSLDVPTRRSPGLMQLHDRRLFRPVIQLAGITVCDRRPAAIRGPIRVRDVAG